MNNDTHKRNIILGTIWSVAGSIGYLLVALVANIILVRFLSPYEFGQVGIVMFFIVISKVLTESGLSGALIRKKDVSDIDYSTVFLFNLSISSVLVILLVSTSGLIADFYGDAELESIIKVSSVVLIINAFQIIHYTKLIQQLQFKKKAAYEFVSILMAAIIAIILAANEFGVWAVVALQVLTSLFITIILWVFGERIKIFTFSQSAFQGLYKFGINTTIASLLNTAFDNIYQLILGKYFAISQTGLFYQAKKIQEIPQGLLAFLAHGVIFSTLAKVQDDRIRFNFLFNRIITAVSVLVGFICLFVVLYAKNIIVILYGPEWTKSAFFLQILIISVFFFMHQTFNEVIFKTFDQTQKILYLEIAKKIIQSISIVIGVVFLDIEILLYGFLFTSIANYFLNLFYARREIGESVTEEMYRTFKIISSAVITAGFLYFMIYYLDIDGYSSFLLIPIMMMVYALMLKVLKVFDIIKDFKIVLRSIIKKT